jgi:putative membrane protein
MMFFVYSLIGALAASILACIPALHIYNVVGLLLLLGAGASTLIGPEELSALMIGLITGYAMLNTLPSIFLSAPDDSTIFVVLPGQKYLLQRRGWEATLLTGVGGLGGLAVLTLLTPVASNLFSTARAILQPHLHWILLAVILFMLMSEWPKGTDRAKTPWGKLAEAWTSLTAGLATFFLSGLLGFILMYRGLVPVDVAYQNLLPAFVGLFAIPWVLQNILSRTQIPPQHIAASVDANLPLFLRGIFAGTIGGLFAAFFPVVTGGIGGFIAGHATAQRDDRLFLISQGASKVVYYVGGFLLFFVPGLHLTRGGMAWMLSGVYTPYTPDTFHRAVAAILLSGMVSFFMLLLLTRLIIRLVERVDYRWLSVATLAVLLTIVTVMTGPGGLLIAAVATGIGLIPVLWGSRRMNCMGVLLLPIMLNMFGVGGTVAGWLGLV